MPGRFSSDYALVRSVMQSQKVRAKLAEVAAPGPGIANARAKSEGVSISAQLSHGTRPRGRPYSRISFSGGVPRPDYDPRSPNDSWRARRRVLGMVANSLSR